MYNQAKQSKQNYVSSVNTDSKEDIKFPMLESNMNTLFNYLNDQESLIRQVQSKLHKIIDKNMDAKEPDVPKPIAIDIEHRLGEQISHLNDNNLLLINILNHLSEII